MSILVDNDFAYIVQNNDGSVLIRPNDKRLRMCENDQMILLSLYTWLMNRGVRND